MEIYSNSEQYESDDNHNPLADNVQLVDFDQSHNFRDSDNQQFTMASIFASLDNDFDSICTLYIASK